MEVNGLPLPPALVQAVQDGQTKWMFKALVNAYGDELDCLDVELVDFQTMREDTPDQWSLSPGYGGEYQPKDETGLKPSIRDLSRLVVCGRNAYRLDFCLDYQDNRQAPTVICRTGKVWRRVAPDFSAFMELLEPYEPQKFWEHARALLGHPLPVAFTQLCEAIRREGLINEWELKEDMDAYGQPWTNGGFEPYTDPVTIAEETRGMEWRFREDRRLQHHEEARNEPGFIQDFTGVSQFVRFGTNASGEVYCLDFGGDPREPSVVTWDQYWRRVAPNFEAFMDLFVPWGERTNSGEADAPPQPGDTEWEALKPTARTLLAAWTLKYVLVKRGGPRPLFEDLVSDYLACNEEERREAEAEVREKLERDGMTDEQRRTLDELWARLSAKATQPLQPGDKSWKAVRPTPQTFHHPWVQRVVAAGPEDSGPLLELLVSGYAELSPEQRREVQNEIREAADRWQLTDEQQRRLDEVRELLTEMDPA